MKQLVVIAILLGSVVSFGQGFIGGLNGGISASQVSGDSRAGYNKLGLYGGLYTRLSVQEKNAIQFELNYIEKGSRDSKDQDFYIKLKYIDLSVIYMLSYKDKFKFLIGASYGTLIGSPNFSTYYVRANPPFRDMDVSSVLGIHYPLNKTLDISLRSINTIFLFPIKDHQSGAKRMFNRGMYNSVLTISLQQKL